MSWTTTKYLQITIYKHTISRYFFLAAKKKTKNRTYNSSPWTLHSVHTVLENSIVQSNPILRHSTTCWDFVSTTPFNFVQLHMLFPVFLTVPTWFLHILSKLHFLPHLLLSLPFLFLYNKKKTKKTQFLVTILKIKIKNQRKRKGTHNPCTWM